MPVALGWVVLLAPFVIWLPIVLAIMRKMDWGEDGEASAAAH